MTEPPTRNPGWFTPGQSGNPGGRPKVLAEVQALAREHTPAAITALAGIVKNTKEPAAARVAAANSLLDRAWGRAQTTIDVTGKVTLESLINAALGHEPPTVDGEMDALPSD